MSCQLQSAGVDTPPHKEHGAGSFFPHLTIGKVHPGFKVFGNTREKNAEEQLFYGLLFY